VRKVRKVGRKHGPGLSGGKTLARYLSVEFRAELRRKAYLRLVNADFQHSSDGTRFPKDLPETPLFGAVQYLRNRAHKIWSSEPVPEYDSQAAGTIGRYVLEAISTETPGKLRDLATILKLCGAPRSPTAKHIPWVYYSASAALRLLDDGVLPTKRQVLKEAIRQRALEELLLAGPPGEALTNRGRVIAKLEDITRYRSPRNWAHIFRVLDLGEVPA
jgi:hypothetical protein